MAEECKYYYYDGGYCCALKKEKEGYSSIDSDTAHRYCWGYHYDECPRYKNRDSSSKECRYYYYDSGYSCSLKREKEGNSSIDSDTVHRYCWGYDYEGCPRYKNRDSSSGSCFLTSACVEAKGLPDDCRELTVLRGFRDSYLAGIEGGKAEICEYYHIAPAIVSNIKARPDSLKIFERIYNELVMPCVEFINEGKNEEAHKLYRSYTLLLKGEYT